MKIRKFAVNPRQVRLYEIQEETLNRMFRDKKLIAGRKDSVVSPMLFASD